MNVSKTRLPGCFYTLDGRWYDEFADNAPGIIQPQDLSVTFRRARTARNIAYSKWQASFFVENADGDYVPIFKPKKMLWQAIRVLSFKHSESNSKDWWENYQDALFRVFVQPETVYDGPTGEHKQWYLLSPEDGYLVNKHECESKGASFPPRDVNGRERFLSADKRLRCARFIPVECCRHYRHETTAGILPEGL